MPDRRVPKPRLRRSASAPPLTGRIGLARLATATVTILAIGFRPFSAAALAGDALPVADGMPLGGPDDALVSGLAAIGYGPLFGVPPALGVCILCGDGGLGGRPSPRRGARATPVAALDRLRIPRRRDGPRILRVAEAARSLGARSRHP